MSVRSRLASAAPRLVENLDERLWNRKRDREFPSTLKHNPKPVRADPGVHVLVVPQEGPDFDSWQPGTRNFYFEAWQTAMEVLGAAHVSVLDVARGEHWQSWIPRLVSMANDVGATHIISHIESDPGGDASTWHWDVAWAELLRSWDGVLLGVVFDSAYFWIAAQSRRLARMSPRFMVVDICTPLHSAIRGGRPEVGPVNMPMSAVSLDLIRERCASVEKTCDVSFVGALYPYRVQALEELQNRGVSVSVNPHRSDNARDFASSRTNQPSWLDYMAALAASRITINFSQSSAGPVQQLKTRVIEAMLARTVVATDDTDRTSRFFRPGVDYLHFRDLDDLPGAIFRALSKPGDLLSITTRVLPRAEYLATQGFWKTIDAALVRRGLPRVLGDFEGDLARGK